MNKIIRLLSAFALIMSALLLFSSCGVEVIENETEGAPEAVFSEEVTVENEENTEEAEFEDEFYTEEGSEDEVTSKRTYFSSWQNSRYITTVADESETEATAAVTSALSTQRHKSSQTTADGSTEKTQRKQDSTHGKTETAAAATTKATGENGEVEKVTVTLGGTTSSSSGKAGETSASSTKAGETTAVSGNSKNNETTTEGSTAIELPLVPLNELVGD